MSMLRTLADWRIVAVLIAIGVGVALVSPNLIGAAIPLLIVAACPVSMVVMMRSMGGHGPSPSVDLNRADDRRGRLRDQLAAIQLERLQLEQELAGLDDADDRSSGAARRTAAPTDVWVERR